jgi:hypothetical protein
VGADVENLAIDAVGHDNIEHVAYKAHCSKCHTVADIDLVTRDAVIEVKRSASGVSRKQLVQHTIPVANACFPGKQIVLAVPKRELYRLNKKLAEKEWADLVSAAMGV